MVLKQEKYHFYYHNFFNILLNSLYTILHFLPISLIFLGVLYNILMKNFEYLLKLQCFKTFAVKDVKKT